MAFFIEKINENGFEEVLVKNTLTGTYFSIIPSHGAALNRFYFKNQAWIDGYESANQIKEKPYKSAFLAPFPNRIKDGKYQWENTNYQLPINRPQENHAIHGFLYHKAFEIDREKIKKKKATIRLKYHYEGDYPGYPFAFSVKIKYILSNRDVLKIKTRVKNTGKTSLPFGLGFHPYFKTSISFDESFLKMPPCQILPLDERMLPTTEVKNHLNASQEFQGKDLKLDDCFKLIEKTKGLFILKDPNTKNALEISSKNLTYFQLYTPANRKSIAIEPMSCPPNVLNNGLDLLKIKPKEKYKFVWSIKGISKH